MKIKVLMAMAFLMIGCAVVVQAQEQVQVQEQAPAQAQMAPQTVPSQVDMRFAAANQWLNRNNLSVTTAPDQAFVNGYFLVSAEGLPSATATSPAQRRLTATRAAEVLAYRQLAEYLDGVAIVGDSVVKDAELQYDVVRAAVAGMVKGAMKVYQEYNEQEGSALVILKLGMTGPRGFGQIMYEKVLGNPNVRKGMVEPKPEYKEKPVPLEESYDGLIVDATEQSFRPALVNRIFTPKGDVLYDPSKVSQRVLVEQGCGEYTNTVDKAKAALESREVKNPMVVKAIGTVSAADLQVSDDDSVKIYSANQKAGFFAKAKVAFVLK